MKISFLGTSCALASARRDHTSILVQTHLNLILMDVSGNCPGKLLRLNYDPNDLDIILLTHLHIDHCYGLPALLFHMFLAERTRDIHIVVSREEGAELERQLAAYDLFPDVRTFSVILHKISAPCILDIPGASSVSIKAAVGIHSRFNLAYRIHDLHTNISCTYSGDTRPCSDIENLARHTNLLIHEATYLEKDKHYAEEYGHSTSREAARVADNAEAGSLALVHLNAPQPAQNNNLKAEAETAFKGRIFIPDDMDTLMIQNSGDVFYDHNSY